MFLILIVCLMKLLEMTSKRALMRQRAVQANRRASGAGGDDGGFGGCECAAGRGCCLDDDNDAGVMMVHVGKENRAINGHLRNYLSSTAAIKNGNAPIALITCVCVSVNWLKVIYSTRVVCAVVISL